ncbi:FDLD family class I lanthipeptide [Brevibacillus formosus]|uniref:FDLD family class I lanthipeptide n=1 Tax=Brevibacillus formosus TaxID=54913 RepID=UPI0012FD0DF7
MKNDMFDLDVQVNTVSASGVKPDSWPYPDTLMTKITCCNCTWSCKGFSDEK